MFIPDFDADTRETLPSLDPDLLSMNQFLNAGLPIISQALTRIIANRINHRSGRQGALLEDVAGALLNQGLSGQFQPNRPPFTTQPFNPSAGGRSQYFRTSQGQMLAQMASAIARASQRYL